MSKILLFAFLFLFQLAEAQELPLGYIEHYRTDFSSNKLNGLLLHSAHAGTKLDKGIWYLEEKPDSLERFNPAATLIVDNNIFGDFIVETRININWNKVDSLSGFYLITGLRDSANYYLIRLNASGAEFLKMYKGELTKIATDSTFLLKNQVWNNLRIIRDIISRSITLKTNKNGVTFSDPNLIMGYFGLGVNDYRLALSKLIIWAPTSIVKPAPVFR